MSTPIRRRLETIRRDAFAFNGRRTVQIACGRLYASRKFAVAVREPGDHLWTVLATFSTSGEAVDAFAAHVDRMREEVA